MNGFIMMIINKHPPTSQHNNSLIPSHNKIIRLNQLIDFNRIRLLKISNFNPTTNKNNFTHTFNNNTIIIRCEYMINYQLQKILFLQITIQTLSIQQVKFRLMNSNFHSNQILYVKGIGYARLAIDTKHTLKSSPDHNNPQTNQTQDLPSQTQLPGTDNQSLNDSILFDPQMFKIDADSPFSESQIQVNLSQLNTRKKSMQLLIRRQSSDSNFKQREQIIVPLKLQQTNVMIYCPQPYLMKKITLVVKSLLQNSPKTVTLNIDITKTIDNLKTMVFKELGEEMGLYSDVKLFTVAPRMEDLNIGSKTIWQYMIKDKAKITLMAKFNFSFLPLDPYFLQYFVLTNNNHTVANVQKKAQNVNITTTTPQTTSVQPVQPVATTLPEQGTPPANQPQQPSTTTQPVIAVNTNPLKKQEQHPQQTSQQPQYQSPSKQNKHQQTLKFQLQCNAKLRSGIHYWEVKIDKLNSNKQQTTLLIGIMMKSVNQTQKDRSTQFWAFDPIRSKKVEHHEEKKLLTHDKQQKELNASDESDEEYGSYAKTGDTIGVLLIIKEKHVKLIFYKNSTCLQECYDFNLHTSHNQNTKDCPYLVPFVTISGQIQLTLDSKASSPLDSYRFK